MPDKHATTTRPIVGALICIFLFIGIAGRCLWAGGTQDNAENQAANSPQPPMAPAPSVQPESAGNMPSNRQLSLYKGDGGKGIVIVVPAPVIQNHSASDAWIPQLFQDIITGDLVRYSAMTVIDRANEQLILAEQSISSSGNYSDDDYIRMGSLTNAQYIVAGKITKISDNYSVSLRINSTETNEIKAAFDKTYSLKDIESGLAPKEAVRELLAGMGIQLTEAGEKSLLATQEAHVQASAQLAKGMAAEKSGNIVEALAFFSGALDADATKAEAGRHIQSFFGDIATANIQERINYALVQEAKWKKIFEDLKIYIRENLPVTIYDFSIIEDAINTSSKTVRLKVSPGIKVIPNRTTLLVYKKIFDEWHHISEMPENKGWVMSVKRQLPYSLSHPHFVYSIDIGLYDSYGDCVAEDDISLGIVVSYSPGGKFQVLAQHKYYNDKEFNPITFSVSFDKITDTMEPRIIGPIYMSETKERFNAPVLSVGEWEQWLQLQGTAQ